MAYNKASEEKKWLLWKEAEERKLRELGVNEDTIQRLHTYDWAEFNRERQYRQRRAEWPEHFEPVSAQDIELPVNTPQAMLDSIENNELLYTLLKENPITINAVFLKTLGYTTEQICRKLGISEYSYYNRIKRLKKKIKKFM